MPDAPFQRPSVFINQRLFRNTGGLIRQRVCAAGGERNEVQNNPNQLICSSCSIKWPSSVQIQFESQRFHFLSDWRCCSRKWGSEGKSVCLMNDFIIFLSVIDCLVDGSTSWSFFSFSCHFWGNKSKHLVFLPGQ